MDWRSGEGRWVGGSSREGRQLVSRNGGRKGRLEAKKCGSSRILVGIDADMRGNRRCLLVRRSPYELKFL